MSLPRTPGNVILPQVITPRLDIIKASSNVKSHKVYINEKMREYLSSKFKNYGHHRSLITTSLYKPRDD